MFVVAVVGAGAAVASGPDAGAKDAPTSEAPVSRARWGKERGTREQAKFAAMIVLAAVGVYVAYRVIRR